MQQRQDFVEARRDGPFRVRQAVGGVPAFHIDGVKTDHCCLGAPNCPKIPPSSWPTIRLSLIRTVSTRPLRADILRGGY